MEEDCKTLVPANTDPLVNVKEAEHGEETDEVECDKEEEEEEEKGKEDPFLAIAEEYVKKLEEESGYFCDLAVVVPGWEGSVVLHMRAEENKEGNLLLTPKECHRLAVKFSMSGQEINPSNTPDPILLNRAVASFVRTQVMQDVFESEHKVNMVIVGLQKIRNGSSRKGMGEQQNLQGLMVANLEAHKPFRHIVACWIDDCLPETKKANEIIRELDSKYGKTVLRQLSNELSIQHAVLIAHNHFANTLAHMKIVY
jgi:hypothetical protein